MMQIKITDFSVCPATAKNSGSTSKASQLNAKAYENFNAASRPVVTPLSERSQAIEGAAITKDVQSMDKDGNSFILKWPNYTGLEKVDFFEQSWSPPFDFD